MTTYIKSVIAAGLAVFLLTGCSSGTTATGLGLSIGGTWTGTFTGAKGFKGTFTLQLAQAAAGADDPFAAAVLTGVINTDKPCIGSGGITEGTLSGNDVIMSFDNKSMLRMVGKAKTNYMSGSWVLGEVVEETTTTDEEGNVTTSSSSSGACEISGGNWEASR